MSENANEKFVNKYIRVLKTRYDALMNDIINLETQFNLLKDVNEEQTLVIQKLNEKVSILEEQLTSQKSARSTSSKTKTEKEETF